jgi:hypothetical protein
MSKTVKQIKTFLQTQDSQTLAAMQQLLEWHGGAKRLERILWATLEAERIALTDDSIQNRMEYELARKQHEQDVEDGKVEIVQPPLHVVIGLCGRCQSKVYGEIVPECETKLTGRVFYKECAQCSYYAEIFKRRNSYYEIEGGE